MSIFTGKTNKQEEELNQMVENETTERIKEMQKSTMISKGVTLDGKIQGNGPIFIGGTLNGSIDISGEARIFNGGSVVGPINADILVVSGLVKGDVRTAERLVISSSGEIIGNVETTSLIIEDGGRLNGSSKMIDANADNAIKISKDTVKQIQENIECKEGTKTVEKVEEDTEDKD